jgi:hypothetical protein
MKHDDMFRQFLLLLAAGLVLEPVFDTDGMPFFIN